MATEATDIKSNSGCYRATDPYMASVWPLVASWASDINTDPSYGRTMNPDMALSSIPGLDLTMTTIVVQVTQISMDMIAARPSVTNIAPGG